MLIISRKQAMQGRECQEKAKFPVLRGRDGLGQQSKRNEMAEAAAAGGYSIMTSQTGAPLGL